MRPFKLKSFAWLLLIFIFPLTAKGKNCRGSLSASAPKTIKQHPKISKEVEKALLKVVPKAAENELGYFLTTLFNAVARDNGYEQFDFAGLPFKALSKMPYDVQIEYFTRVKNHFLLNETPPEGITLLSKGGTPQYIPKESREALLKILNAYDLRDIEMDFLKFSPVEARDLEGASLEVYYSSNMKDLVFQIDIADDGTAVVHSDGRVLAAGPWRIESGFLKIDSKDKIQIDLRRATSETLKEAHTEITRVHEWGPFALVQVRHLREEANELDPSSNN